MSLQKLSLLPLTLALASTAYGAEAMPSQAQMWKMIQQQQKEIQALKEQLKQTNQTVTTVQTKTEETVAQMAEVKKEPPQEAPKAEKAPHWTDRIQLSGTVEVEAFSGKDFARNRASDINLATAELGLEMKINDWAKGKIVLLYEDPDTDPVNVDQAFITLGNPDKSPLFLNAGLMTVPFGTFNTNMVSDPLTLTLAENGREGTVEAGIDYEGFYASIYAFNGQIDRGSNAIHQGGARAGYKMDKNGLKMDVGADFTNSLDDSDGLTTAIQVNVPASRVQDHISAVAAHMMIQYAGVTAIGEYVTALDSFQPAEVLWGGRRAKPRAWQTELGYTFDMAEKETTVSVGWQGSYATVDGNLALPEDRKMCAIKVGVLENTTLGLEYAHDKDFSIADGGSGNSGHVATAQLAVTF